MGYKEDNQVMYRSVLRPLVTVTKYSYAPYNDVSVNDGPHIRLWSHNTIIYYYNIYHTAVAQWLRCCATNRKVTGSIAAGVSEIFL